MQNLVMIPAFGCDAGLYRDITPGLSDIISPQTIMATADNFEACVGQILGTAPKSFVVLGTSFGGRAALEVALTAPDRVTGLVVIGHEVTTSATKTNRGIVRYFIWCSFQRFTATKPPLSWESRLLPNAMLL